MRLIKIIKPLVGYRNANMKKLLLTISILPALTLIGCKNAPTTTSISSILPAGLNESSVIITDADGIRLIKMERKSNLSIYYITLKDDKFDPQEPLAQTVASYNSNKCFENWTDVCEGIRKAAESSNIAIVNGFIQMLSSPDIKLSLKLYPTTIKSLINAKNYKISTVKCGQNYTACYEDSNEYGAVDGQIVYSIQRHQKISEHSADLKFINYGFGRVVVNEDPNASLQKDATSDDNMNSEANPENLSTSKQVAVVVDFNRGNPMAGTPASTGLSVCSSFNDGACTLETPEKTYFVANETLIEKINNSCDVMNTEANKNVVCLISFKANSKEEVTEVNSAKKIGIFNSSN